MEREQIERLAIDSSAGQLNEDTQALFKEYLAGHSQANKWVEDMLGIYQKTEAAISIKTKHAAKTDTIVAEPGTKPHSVVYWLPIARWAAVIAIAAFAGIGIGRWTRSPVVDRSRQVAVDLDSTVKGSDIEISDTGGSFWREKALAMFQAKPIIVGEVSMTSPTLWEKYRQIIKERHYE